MNTKFQKIQLPALAARSSPADALAGAADPYAAAARLPLPSARAIALAKDVALSHPDCAHWSGLVQELYAAQERAYAYPSARNIQDAEGLVAPVLYSAHLQVAALGATTVVARTILWVTAASLISDLDNEFGLRLTPVFAVGLDGMAPPLLYSHMRYILSATRLAAWRAAEPSLPADAPALVRELAKALSRL